MSRHGSSPPKLSSGKDLVSEDSSKKRRQRFRRQLRYHVCLVCSRTATTDIERSTKKTTHSDTPSHIRIRRAARESRAQRQIEVNLKLATSTPRVPESIVFPAWVTCTYQHTEMQAPVLKTDSSRRSQTGGERRSPKCSSPKQSNSIHNQYEDT
jgi:hypothetical protein